MESNNNPYQLISKLISEVYWLAIDMVQGESQVKINLGICSVKSLLEQLELSLAKAKKTNQALYQSKKFD